MNNLLLPVLGDKIPFNIGLFDEDLQIEDKLFNHFGGCIASLAANWPGWAGGLRIFRERKIR